MVINKVEVMFKYANITQLICRFLGVDDVLELRVVDRKTCADIERVLAGMTRGKHVTEHRAAGSIQLSITTIPLLGIREAFPVSIAWNEATFSIKRLCGIRELRAKTVCVSPMPCSLAPICIYTANGYVKHVIVWFVMSDTITARTPPSPIELLRMLDTPGDVEQYTVTNPKLAESISNTYENEPSTSHLLASKRFLRYITEFN